MRLRGNAGSDGGGDQAAVAGGRQWAAEPAHLEV